MKTIKFTFFAVVFFQIAMGQSKRDLLEQIEIYQKSVYENKAYDVDRAKVYDAMNQVGALEYPKVMRESESRGFCEWTLEQDAYKETLTIEIANDKQPYRINYTIKQERRSRKPDGSYTEWQSSNEMPSKYLKKLQKEMWEAIFGPIKLSPELQSKIDKYNEVETKQRKQIIAGRDY